MAVLELTYDPAWAAVRIVVDGGMWGLVEESSSSSSSESSSSSSSESSSSSGGEVVMVDAIRIVRSAPGYPEIPVRGVEMKPVLGGYWIGTDHEMPLGLSVQYTVTGYYQGEVVESHTASVDVLPAAGNTVWVKVPGVPDLSVNAQLHAISDVVTATMGGTYQPASGGVTIAQWGGVSATSLTLTLQTWGRGQRAALLRTLAAGRVLLIQPYDEADCPAGWYMVSSVAESNPFQVGIDHTEVRRYRLALTATAVPAGLGVPATGVSWATVMEQHATWADVLSDVPTWFDLQKGA